MIIFPGNKKAPPSSTNGQEQHDETKIDYGLLGFVLGICSVLGTIISVSVQGNRPVFTIIFHYIYLCFSFSVSDLSEKRDPTEPEKGGGGLVTEGKQLISTNFEEIFKFFF